MPSFRCCFITVFLLSAAAFAEEDAARVFQLLYEEKLKAAQSTPAAADDIELAGAMLETARSLDDQPQLLELMCESIVVLGQKNNEGLEIAAQAWRLLADQVPAQRPKALENLAILGQRQLTTAKLADRPAIGEDLIDTLLELADAKQKSDQPTEAVALYQRATLIANQIRSPRHAQVRQLLDQARSIQQIQAKLSLLQERLLKNANDDATALEIVRLYVIELDDPDKAKPFLSRVKDQTWLAAVPLMMKDAESLTGQESLTLGDFFEARYKEAAPAAKPTMAARAKEHYERFLASTAATGLVRTRVELHLKELNIALAAAPPTSTGPTRIARSELDLLRIIDPKKNTIDGEVRMERGSLVLESRPPVWSRVAVPVALSGAYEVRITFTRTAGGEDLSVALPVAGRSILHVIDGWGASKSGLHRGGDELMETRVGSPLTNGKKHTVVITVTPDEQKQIVTIRSTLEGKPLIDWTGNIRQLHVPASDIVGPLGNLGLRTPNSTYIVHDFKVKAVTGSVQRTDNVICSRRAGGQGGGVFMHATLEGGFLVGLRGNAGHLLQSIQPIFRDAAGKVTEGPRVRNHADTPFEHIAKEGYAVGGLNMRAGSGLDGFEIVFMKIKGTRLDPDDSYKSPWVGGRGGGDHVLDGKGDAVIGIHGGTGADFDGLGLIYRR